MSNLKLLNTTTIGSSVANVDVTNVFSGDYRYIKLFQMEYLLLVQLQLKSI